MMYFIETECGGENAAGGGCGALLDVRKVTDETFNSTPGKSRSYFTNACRDEVLSNTGFDPGDLEEDIFNEIRYGIDRPVRESIQVKIHYRPCSGCYQRV